MRVVVVSTMAYRGCCGDEQLAGNRRCNAVGEGQVSVSKMVLVCS